MSKKIFYLKKKIAALQKEVAALENEQTQIFEMIQTQNNKNFFIILFTVLFCSLILGDTFFNLFFTENWGDSAVKSFAGKSNAGNNMSLNITIQELSPQAIPEDKVSLKYPSFECISSYENTRYTSKTP